MSGERLKEFHKKQSERLALAEAPTQTTGAIRPIRSIRPVRLATTDAIPAVKPPDQAVIHIASFMPSLLELIPVSKSIILTGIRAACLNRYIVLQDAKYRIVKIYWHPDHTGVVMGKLVREDA